MYPFLSATTAAQQDSNLVTRRGRLERKCTIEPNFSLNFSLVSRIRSATAKVVLNLPP